MIVLYFYHYLKVSSIGKVQEAKGLCNLREKNNRFLQWLNKEFHVFVVHYTVSWISNRCLIKKEKKKSIIKFVKKVNCVNDCA